MTSAVPRPRRSRSQRTRSCGDMETPTVFAVRAMEAVCTRSSWPVNYRRLRRARSLAHAVELLLDHAVVQLLEERGRGRERTAWRDLARHPARDVVVLVAEHRVAVAALLLVLAH